MESTQKIKDIFKLGNKLPETVSEKLFYHVENLCKIPGRGFGNPGETIASEYIVNEFKQMGLNPESQPFKINPYCMNVYFLHVAVAMIAYFATTFNLWLGLSLYLLNMISFYGDFTAKFYWLRSLLPAKPSFNVFAKVNASEKAKIHIVVSGHHDAPKVTPFFHPLIGRPVARFFKIFRKSPPIFFMLFYVIVLLPLFQILELQTFVFVSFVIFLIYVFGFVSTLLSPINQGANDNATSVALILELARHFKKNPLKEVEFTFLSTGMEEAILSGMKAFIKKYKNSFDKETTHFIALECCGGGKIHYAEGEGAIQTIRYSKFMRSIAKKVIGEFNSNRVQSFTSHNLTDGYIPQSHGFKSIMFIGLDDHFMPPHYHLITDTPENINRKTLDDFFFFLNKYVREIEKTIESGSAL